MNIIINSNLGTIRAASYIYKGHILDDKPHGTGMFTFTSSTDEYIGECKFGKFDGFGIYKHNKNRVYYIGHFVGNLSHGEGISFHDNTISKGIWINDKKYGIFIKTNFINFKTHKQKWDNGNLVHEEEIQYIPASILILNTCSVIDNIIADDYQYNNNDITYYKMIRSNMNKILNRQSPKSPCDKFRYINKYKPYENKELCVACLKNKKNSVTNKCGHLIMCYECLSKCNKKCPVCRVPFDMVLKIYTI
jgi:hypothetical protein